jgi:hypothetical protein
LIEFRKIGDNEPALQFSPIVRAAEKTFSYLVEHGSIELTPGKSFRRNFVHWAASAFEWPGYTAEELFKLNKVLNEADFAPLMHLHDMLLSLKIGRHYKGKFILTKPGRSLAHRPGKIFGIIAPFFLFHVNHEYLSRRPIQLTGNWDVFLNVLNVEAENGVTATALRETLYGPHDPTKGYDESLGGLYVQVLRPLCWVGLLVEHGSAGSISFGPRTFIKTPLWRVALQLDTDSQVQPATRH